MRCSRIAAALALPLVAAANSDQRRQNTALARNSTAPIPGGFIVEYVAGRTFTREGKAASGDITVLKTFDSDIFRGASISAGTHNLHTLLQLAEVANVWPNTIVALPPVEEPQSLSEDATASEYSAHSSTGVNKLHERGIFGEGVTVGIVDTGTDYTHPALGGGLGSGFKVAKGHDFVGNGYWPDSGEKAPDDDPLDQQGHGTHVAGILAGKTDTWSGVAPAATIYSYKVFSLADTTDQATLIESFLAAYGDGVDIVTASIGRTDGWSSNAWAEVASRIVEEGVVVTIAAGNSGAAGTFFPSSGSSGKNVLAVASVSSPFVAASPFNATFSLDGFVNTTVAGYLPSTSYFPDTIVDWPIVPLNFNTSEPAEACLPYPNGTQRLEGVIPLVRRGTCTFATKQTNLQAIGAEYILFYNTEAALTTPYTENYDSLIALVSAEAGAAIIETVKAGGNVTADFSINPENVVGLNDPAGGRPSIFTSWGALYDLQIKPDIAAPGGAVYSTYLNNTFAILSGTSMACPYVAGVAALYISVHGGRSVHGKRFAKSLHNRIIASGKALPWSDGTETNFGYAASVAQVGNGILDAFKIVNYTTSLEFEKFALNDTAHFSGYHTVAVTNTGTKPVTYSFTSEAAAGVEILGFYPLPPVTQYDPHLKSFSELTPSIKEVGINFPSAFTLQAGQSKTVTVDFNNPDTLGWNASVLPVYSGKVIIRGDNGEQLSIPYLGLGANLNQEMAPIYRPTYPFSVSGQRALDITAKSSYVARRLPQIYSKMKWGAKEVRWDIFDAGWSEQDWVYPPVVGVKGYVGPAAGWTGAGKVNWFDPALYDPEDTYTYPVMGVFRNAETQDAYHEYWWFGKLGNGSQIDLGNYTMRFATLEPFGNPAVADDWSVFETPEISVLGKYERKPNATLAGG
ncbi:hypothetical protein PZA11_000384 [Diplocarpon coronariae]